MRICFRFAMSVLQTCQEESKGFSCLEVAPSLFFLSGPYGFEGEREWMTG